MATQEIGTNFKENIFKAWEKLIWGFFQTPKNNLDPNDPEDLLKVKHSTIVLLFRFFFLLFGIAKGILDPTDSHYCHIYSFHQLKYDIANGKYKNPLNTTLWYKLKEFFSLINRGNEGLYPYDGDLFDPIKNPNLEEWEIEDSYLSEAIDLISRMRDTELKKLIFVDYSELKFRLLGTIYEGLLEFELHYSKNRELSLIRNKGKKKPKGIFYTPKEIVKCIVEHALEPMVKQKLNEARHNTQTRSEAILSIKILDNAMGCGYFLEESVEYLAKELNTIHLMENDIEGSSENDSYTLIRAKREILSHCIYGVDSDDIAVELSRMILWFTTFSQDCSANVLRNRLKLGNSLVGELFEELDILYSLQQEYKRVKNFKESHTCERFKTIADLKTAITYGNLIEHEKYKELYTEILKCNEETWIQLKQLDDIKRIKQISEEKLFFHWQLEFPEIFFELDNFGKERNGFDVILGNPPWASVRGKYSAHMFDDYEISYLEDKFPENTYMPNAYEYFILQSLKLLKKGGRHSYIVPDRLAFNESLEYLRIIMLNKYSLNSLIFNTPFPYIIADTLIYSLTAKKQVNDYKITIRDYKKEAVVVNSNYFQSARETEFSFYRSKEIFKTIKAIEAAHTIKIGHIAETTSGFGGKSNLITKNRVSNQQIEVIKGLNIGRYSLNGKLYFEFKKENITGRTTDIKKLGAIPKVLLRKTGKVLYSAYDETGIYPEQSLYFLYNFKGKYSPFYILSLINSSLFKFYYIEKLVTNRDTTPQLKKIHLDRFPIKKIEFTDSEMILKSSYTKTIEFYESFLNNGDLAKFESFINGQFEKDDNNPTTIKTEVLHDVLAYLAQKMTDYNRNKLKFKSFEMNIYLTDKLIDLLVFKLYNLNSNNLKTINEVLTERGI